MNKQESARRQVLAAINQMERRVSIADVVTKTGLSLNTVSSIVNDIAHESQAHLEVTTQGVIYYIFPGNLNYVYFSNRLLHFLHAIWERISPYAIFLFRISFGLVLLFSIALVFSIMFVIQVMVSVLAGHTSGVANTFKEFYYLMRRLLRWNVVPTSLFKLSEKALYTPGYKQSATTINTVSDTANSISTTIGTTDGDKGFLLNCYAFLFGPGDPNVDYYATQARLIAQLIRNNDGVLLPEQLSPYTGTAPDEPEELFHILSSFNGYPETTESGHLVYVFPDMQATGTEAAIEKKDIPAYLALRTWTFAGISKNALKPIIVTALFNFSGTAFFFWILFAARTSNKSVALLFFVLSLYGLFFLTFPAYRWIVIFFKNIHIRGYNERVEEYRDILQSDHPDLQEARAEAQNIRDKFRVKPTEKLEYTTARDYLDQEAEKLLLESSDSQTDSSQ